MAAAPATTLFTETELVVLDALPKKLKLASNPTVHDALLATASLGGHLKNNGEPGWQSLGDGLIELLKAVAIYELFQRNADSVTQSFAATRDV